MSFVRKFLTPVTEEPQLSEASDSLTEAAFTSAPKAVSAPFRPNAPIKTHNLYPFIPSEKIPTSYDSSDIGEEPYIKPLESYTTEDFVGLISKILLQKEIEGKKEEGVKASGKPFSIKSYFENKGILFDASRSKESIVPLEALAFTIAINYPLTKHFIRFLRDKIVKKDFEFSYNLSTLSPDDRNSTVALAEKLDEYGYICCKNKTPGCSTIKGTISSCPKCINFINGSFLELYAKSVTVSTIKKLSKEYKLDYEVLTNVQIEKNDEKHELDLVFRIGNQVFWGEVKTSDFDADKYRKIGILMGVVPDRLILLAAEKSNDATAVISENYDYYCANISTFKKALTEMTEKALNNL